MQVRTYGKFYNEQQMWRTSDLVYLSVVPILVYVYQRQQRYLKWPASFQFKKLYILSNFEMKPLKDIWNILGHFLCKSHQTVYFSNKKENTLFS